MTTPVRIAITGAAGQIGYSLLFRIASGAMLGPDTPVILQLLEVTPALGALGGVKMELDDCAFSPLVDVICTDDANVAVRVTGTPTNVLPLFGVNVTLVAALVICMVTTLDFDPRKFTLSPE